MIPLFSPRAPWAHMVLLWSGFLCLPLSGVVVNEIITQRQLSEALKYTYQDLDAYNRAKRQLHEAELRRQLLDQKKLVTPTVLKMMDKIGSLLTPELALITVEVDASKKNVRLNVKAKTLNTLLVFSEQLQKISTNVALNNHQEVRDKDPVWPVSAMLEVYFAKDINNASEYQ